MNIMAPLCNTNKNEAKSLIDQGATKLYCGYIPDTWRNKYYTWSPNRRGYEGSFHDYDELSKSISLAHEHYVPVYVTMNERYTENQYEDILNIVREVCDAGADGLIIGDISLALLCFEREIEIPIRAGTGCVCFNTKTIEMYYDLGVESVVLPRSLTIEEIKTISSQYSNLIELEVFVLNAKCTYIDGLCGIRHDISDPISNVQFGNQSCGSKRLAPPVDLCGTQYDIECMNQHCTNCYNITVDGGVACGACTLWEFLATGINSCKIVGRGYSLERRLQDIRFIRECLSMLASCDDKEEYYDSCKKLYLANYQKNCRNKICYYDVTIV